jgi:ABC-type multidrug transport system fused ATPase/permease subunit
MIEERFIILTEKFFDKNLADEEKKELDDFLMDEDYKKEFQKQINVKEAVMNLNLKKPKSEFWDNYWLSTYNRLERGVAWILISIGLTLLIGFAVYQFIQKLFVDDGGPFIIKIGLIVLFTGALILILSLIREQFIKTKNDSYKEIKR